MQALAFMVTFLLPSSIAYPCQWLPEAFVPF